MWIGFGTAASIRAGWGERCQCFLPCAEGGYWQDFGLEPGSTLRAPGTGLRFAPLWFCFPPQCSSGSSPCWRSAEQGAWQGHQPSCDDTHHHPPKGLGRAFMGLDAHPSTQTCDCSFTMAASISELDSFSSLISLFSCLISSSFSRTAGEMIRGSYQHHYSQSSLCFYVLGTGHTSHLLYIRVGFVVRVFIITVQWHLNRSICKCKSKWRCSSWGPAHPLQGQLGYSKVGKMPCAKLMHVSIRNYEVHKTKEYL